MPKPAGWTPDQLAKRDDCVAKLKARGTDTSKAYAICTSAQQKSGAK